MSYTPNMAHYVPDGSKPGQTAQDPGSFNYSYNPNAYQYPQSSYPYCPQPYPQQLVPASYPQQHQYYQPQYVPSPRPDAKSHWYCDHGSAPPPGKIIRHNYPVKITDALARGSWITHLLWSQPAASGLTTYFVCHSKLLIFNFRFKLTII